MTRTERIATNAFLVACALGLLATLLILVATQQTLTLTLIVVVVGIISVVGVPVVALMRFAPRLIRAIRTPKE